MFFQAYNLPLVLLTFYRLFKRSVIHNGDHTVCGGENASKRANILILLCYIHLQKRFSHVDLDQCNIKYQGVLIKLKVVSFYRIETMRSAMEFVKNKFL
jgi:hypothetical protein